MWLASREPALCGPVTMIGWVIGRI